MTLNLFYIGDQEREYNLHIFEGIELTHFLKRLLKKEDNNANPLLDTEISEIFRTIIFIMDNSAEPKVNLLDKILRFELPRGKLTFRSDKEVFESMLDFFIDKKEQIL